MQCIKRLAPPSDRLIDQLAPHTHTEDTNSKTDTLCVGKDATRERRKSAALESFVRKEDDIKNMTMEELLFLQRLELA